VIPLKWRHSFLVGRVKLKKEILNAGYVVHNKMFVDDVSVCRKLMMGW
jgi:hypothetical protein